MTSVWWERLDAARPRWLNALLLALVAGFGWVLCMRALVLSDEGYLLLQAWDLLQGRVLYSEMDSFVAPGVWFLLAGAFAAFGPSVFVSRVVVLIAWLALVVCTERMVTRHVSRRAGLAAAALVVAFTPWAFPAWTFAFYSPFSVLFAIIALERLLAWWDGAGSRALFACGLFLGLSIVFKQNYGVFALLGACIGFGAMCLERHREGALDARRDVLVPIGITAGGVLAAGTPVLVYLLATGAFPAAWQSLVVHPFEFAGAHDIPVAPFGALFDPDLFTDGVERLTYLAYAKLNTPPIAPLQAFRGVQRMHVLLYWIPLPIFVGGLLLSLHPVARRIDPVLLTVTLVCGAVYLGLFPRADFNHLVNVYQTVIVAGAFVVPAGLRRLGAASPGGARALAVFVTALALLYAAVGVHWWNQLRTRLVIDIGGERGGVKIGRLEAENLGYMIRAVEARTRKGEPLLTVPDLAMVNFLTDRPMPSAFYNLYEHHIAFDGGQSVVDGAEAAGGRVALTRYNNFFSDRRGLLDYAPALADYLETDYRRVALGGNDDYIVLEKRREPIEKRPWIDALDRCDTAEVSPRLVEVRRHLLFSALYHKSRQGFEIPAEGSLTRCRVRVPEAGGELRLEVGYRPPFEVDRGTSLEAVVSIEDAIGRHELGRERFRVAVKKGGGPQLPYRRLAVDLAAWAGQEVELVFETRLDGSVRVHPLDFKGFAQVYRDVRIVHGDDG